MKSAVHLKKVTSVGGTDPAVEVTLRYPKAGFGPTDMGTVMAYVGQLVTVTLDGRGLHVPNAESAPLDKELERVNGRREERMRPLPDATCSRCATLIGDDADAGFYTPPLGPPQPMHERCLAEFGEQEEPSEVQVLEDLLGLVNLGPTVPIAEWTPEEREQAADWADAVHAHASDNLAVEIPDRPDFLAEKTRELPPSDDRPESEPIQTDQMLDRDPDAPIGAAVGAREE